MMHPAASDFLRRPWAPLAVFAAGVAVLRLPSFVYQLFDPDEAAVSAQGIGLWRGGEMYIDGIDRKPPLAPYIYEWSHSLTGNTDLRLPHLLAAIVLFGAVVTIASEAQRSWGRIAMWWAGGLMLTGALAMVPLDAQAANYAHFAMPAGALAMVAARRGTDRAAFVAGFALALATLTRQTWAIGVFPAALAIWRYGDWRRHLPLAFVGGIIPILAIAVALPWEDFFYWTFQSNDGFVLGGAEIGTVAFRGLSAVAIFGALHYVAVRHALAGGRRSIDENLDLWVWLATALVAVSAGYRFYGHYWLQVVPPLALLAAYELRSSSLAVQIRAFRIVGVTAVIAFVAAWIPEAIRDLPDPEPLADAVEILTEEDDTVLVWGNYPEIYWMAERAPAGGFVSMDFVTGRSGARDNGVHTIDDAPERGYEHLLEEIAEQPPELVIDTQPSRFREYGDYPIALFPELDRFIDAHYQDPIVIDGFDVYRLRSP
jgi:hypothetical protein